MCERLTPLYVTFFFLLQIPLILMNLLSVRKICLIHVESSGNYIIEGGMWDMGWP